MVATTKPVDIGTLICSVPEIWHGLPIVAGTRITVASIISLRDEGVTAEDIAHRKHLTLAQVYAALAYYYANQQKMDKEIIEEQAKYDKEAKEAQRAKSGT